ncbi:hypothetical protein [Mucilaginibacter ginkgonis]|uniref:Transposase n=1 Tax=Mucilaginibacter ginkgonis TaxID=2682091 RepID=A0A7T7FCU3_9SPHI|nr:hypothetical protein [Mucilaginibacter ginkgonis]QQL51001.1 hypothetical protein GO620_006000 [Mucilaginibacter ginkgonis]
MSRNYKFLDPEGLYFVSLDYLNNNPVEAGLVDYAHEYLYSSARDYC